MIRYRPFRNTDPRALAEIWRSQPRQRGLVSSMTPALLERMVFSKPYFDRLGLIIAENADGPVGFAHAGFGPDPTRQSLSTRVGVVCLIMIAPHAADDGIADELLARAEAYLRQRGAELTYGGGYDPWAPFYRGLYGGALPPGVLDSDSVLRDALCRGGYAPVAHRLIFQQVLPRFRPLVDRHQMLIRRRFTVEADPDPRAADWWEACMYAQNDRTRFTLSARQGAEPLAQARSLRSPAPP